MKSIRQKFAFGLIAWLIPCILHPSL